MHAERKFAQRNGATQMEKNRLLEINIGMNPTRVELELTEQCNLKCKFCYNSQNPLISDKIFDVIECLHEMGVLEIILTGGEPISHPLFLDILDKCCKYFDKVMVQTNGTLIDAGMAKTLKNKGVYGVNVSLHGDKELHEKLTLVDGSYIQAYEALEHLASEGVNTASNFVLTTENISAFPKTIKKLHDIGVNGMTLTRFTPTGIGADNAYLSISTDQLVKVLEQADSFLENCSNKSFYVLLANSVPYCALPEHLKHYSEYCHFGASRFYIDINGNVLMCGMSRLQIGNILNETFEEMKSKSEIYCNHVCGADVPDYCKKCANFNKCRGGCRAAALACYNKIDGPDPYCKFKEVANNE